MIRDNFGLILPKRVETKIPWSHVLCANVLVEHVTVSLKTIDYIFPLYLYPDPDQNDLFSHLKESKERKPNINEKIFSALSETYKTKPKPEDIFYYIYAVFYSNTYRSKYAEFLKTDFPRVPFTKDERLFKNCLNMARGLRIFILCDHLSLIPRLLNSRELEISALTKSNMTKRVKVSTSIRISIL